jgi:hypothetical protein
MATREQQIKSRQEKFALFQQNALHSNRLSSFKAVSIDIGKRLLGQLATSYTGIPQITPILNSIDFFAKNGDRTKYSTSPFNQLYNLPGRAYNDFRSRKSNSTTTIFGKFDTQAGLSADTRLDGLGASVAASALGIKGVADTLKSFKGAAYLAATIFPGGIYNVFNRDSFGTFGYGWGDHGNPDAFKLDFTLRSHIHTGWKYGKTTTDADGNTIITKGEWGTGLNPLFKVIPFRGDRVNVIDFRKSVSLKDVYRWSTFFSKSKKQWLNNAAGELGETKDFIKFYFTGPKLSPNAINDRTITDDVIVFRATIDGVTDTFNPSWNPVSMIGRADQNYHYQSFSRDISLDFTIYATSRDELKPIYRKLNALAGYTTPDYSAQKSIGLVGSWMRITVGDLFFQVPAVITSLSYTFGDADSPWEINIEDDPENMQVPLKIGVSVGFGVITDWLPQKGGQFYSLTKRYDEFGPLPGNDNWLSDVVTDRPDDLQSVIYRIRQEARDLKRDKDKIGSTGDPKAKETGITAESQLENE